MARIVTVLKRLLVLGMLITLAAGLLLGPLYFFDTRVRTARSYLLYVHMYPCVLLPLARPRRRVGGCRASNVALFVVADPAVLTWQGEGHRTRPAGWRHI